MTSRTLRSAVLIFILILGVAGAASAAPRPAVAQGFLSWLVSLVTPVGPALTPVWQREGSQMDPDGKPNGGLNPSQPSANTDEGSSMDPNGG